MLTASSLAPLGLPHAAAPGPAQNVAVSPDVTPGYEDIWRRSGRRASRNPLGKSFRSRTIATNAITLLQTLTDGTNGVRGLMGGDGLLVSDDHKYMSM